MRDVPEGYGDVTAWPEVRHAEEDEDGARAEVFSRDGQEKFIQGRLHRFDSLNPTAAPENSVRRNEEREAELIQEDRRLRRASEWTKRTISATTRERIGKRRPFLQGVQALGFAALAFFTLWVSTAVVSLYVVGSGSDLFAAHPQDAVWFAVTAILAAGGIKAFEKQLVTDRARHWYRSIFFAVGAGSFVAWSVVAAFAFAPDTSDGRAWITGSGAGNSASIVLVLTHLLSDIAWGYLLYSAAEDWLIGNYKRLELPNPRYVALTEARSGIARERAACAQIIDVAENYLRSVKAGREETAVMAETTFRRAYQFWELREAQAKVVGRGEFLTFIDPPK